MALADRNKIVTYERPAACATCHVDIARQHEQAMMSQAYTHNWDEIEYFELAVPHAQKEAKVAGVKAGCNGCHAPVAFLAGDVPAPAIPAFARKYQFSCSTCHAPAPRLKPFGEQFAARGFRLEDPSQEPPRATYDVGDAHVDLTYDRGIIAGWDFPGGVQSVLQIVNGNGIDAAGDFDNFDNDNLKNVAYRLAKAFKKVRLGGFVYYGREEGDAGIRNRTYYFGPDLVVDVSDRLQINLQYLERRDDNPWFGHPGTGPDWKTRGGFAELIYLPQGPDAPWSLAGLYNKVSSDDPNARYESASLTVGRLLARNVRLAFELGREFERGGTKFGVGLITAF